MWGQKGSWHAGCTQPMPGGCHPPLARCHASRPACREHARIARSGGRMPNQIEIRLLGPFEVRADGVPADVGGSKRQALLAMLALHDGRGVGVDDLVDGLWGEELPAAPRNALHHHIARLRAMLAHESIVGSPSGYALKGAQVDALRFE